MQILYVHEAGHMIVGHRVGLREDGVKFGDLPPGEAAQAWFQGGDLLSRAKRCLGGLLAQVELMPETIVPALLEAYRKSIVFDEAHPSCELISPEDRDFMSGAKDDLIYARAYIAQVLGSDQGAINSKLRELEVEIKTLVARNAAAISSVAEDMEVWINSDDPSKNSWLFYSASRMRDILLKHDS
jgi:hypothetical protein